MFQCLGDSIKAAMLEQQAFSQLYFTNRAKTLNAFQAEIFELSEEKLPRWHLRFNEIDFPF